MVGGTHGQRALTWWGATVPPTRVTLAASTFIGVAFNVAVPGRIFGFSTYLTSADNNDQWAVLWNHDTQKLQRVKEFFNIAQGASNGWRNTWVRPTFRAVPGTNYYLGVLMGTAYFRQVAALATAVTHNSIQFTNGWQSTAIDPLGVTTLNTNANGVDILFQAD